MHKRCTRLVGREQYQSARDGRPGTKPLLTAFQADVATLAGHQSSNLPPAREWSTGSNPVPGTINLVLRITIWGLEKMHCIVLPS